MSSQQQTYTPAQYLEAGYRAEMAAERERAAQYYGYIAEAFAETIEGEAARAGLARLGYAVRPQPQRHDPSAVAHQASSRGAADPAAEPHGTSSEASGYAGGYPQQASYSHRSYGEQARLQTTEHQHRAQSHAPSYQAQKPQPQLKDHVAGPRIRLGELSSQPVTTRPSPAPGDVHAPSNQATHADDRALGGFGEDAMRLPEVVARRARELAELDESLQFEKQYRGARFLAHLVTWLGWIVAAGGLALLVLGFAGIPPSLAGLIIGLPGGVVIGFSGIVAGLALALGGQMALATFDQAQSMREIGIMMRARVEL